MSSLLRILSEFPRLRVLVVGDPILDEYITGDCSRISPEAPVPVLTVRSSRAVLGGAANTAANIAALGGRVVLVGPIGDDDAGRRLVGLAATRGVEMATALDRRPTVRKVRAVGSHQQLLRLDYEVDGSIEHSVAAAVVDQVRRHAPDCSVIVISDYAKGLLSAPLCGEVMSIARANRAPVIIDPRPQHAEFYVGCDYLTPNWKEAQGLVGQVEGPATPAAIDATGRGIVQRFGASVLLTLGAQGMRFFPRDGGPSINQPTQVREVFDVSGAGDTVVASLALAVAAGADIHTALKLANLAAGVVVGKLGTATVSAAELADSDRSTRRLLAREELADLSRALRADGKRIVTTNGSFDVLHPGHLHILREARSQGDVLIVGLNSDASVRKNKGADRPFVTQDERARMLLGLRDVDYVHVFDEPVPMPFLEEVRPDVHVNGSEYGADCIEAETVRRHGGRLHVVERLAGLSTSDLTNRIAQLVGGHGRDETSR